MITPRATFVATDFPHPDDADGVPPGDDGAEVARSSEAPGDALCGVEDGGPTPDPSGARDAASDAALEPPAAPRPSVIATYLADALIPHGWSTDYRWETPGGFSFDARRRKQRYDVSVSLVDPERARFALEALPRAGLFRRKPAKDPAEHITLCLDLDTALRASDLASDIAWYAQREWDGRDDPPATGRPHPADGT